MRSGVPSVWERLEDLMREVDADVCIESASLCMWFGQLRVTLTNPDGAPSRSMAFYTSGQGSPAEVAAALLGDYAIWSKGSRTKPLTVEQVYG